MRSGDTLSAIKPCFTAKSCHIRPACRLADASTSIGGRYRVGEVRIVGSGKGLGDVCFCAARECHIAHRAKYDFESGIRPMGTGLDLVARREGGTTFPVDIMLSPLKHLAEPMVLAVVRDMTERRAVETQKRYRPQSRGRRRCMVRAT